MGSSLYLRNEYGVRYNDEAHIEKSICGQDPQDRLDKEMSMVFKAMWSHKTCSLTIIVLQ